MEDCCRFKFQWAILRLILRDDNFNSTPGKNWAVKFTIILSRNFHLRLRCNFVVGEMEWACECERQNWCTPAVCAFVSRAVSGRSNQLP